MNKGKLYGIGVGPGDSKLLTVKAVEAIQSADMIITPKTEKKEGSVAFNIAKPYISDKTAILPMVFQMNTDMAAVEKQWEENRKIIAEKLDEGKNLVFLTLGDPMLYSTYMYISMSSRILRTMRWKPSPAFRRSLALRPISACR